MNTNEVVMPNSGDRLAAKKEQDGIVKFDAVLNDLKHIHHQHRSFEAQEVINGIDGNIIADTVANNWTHDDILGAEIKAYFRELISGEV